MSDFLLHRPCFVSVVGIDNSASWSKVRSKMQQTCGLRLAIWMVKASCTFLFELLHGTCALALRYFAAKDLTSSSIDKSWPLQETCKVHTVHTVHTPKLLCCIANLERRTFIKIGGPILAFYFKFLNHGKHQRPPLISNIGKNGLGTPSRCNPLHSGATCMFKLKLVAVQIV